MPIIVFYRNGQHEAFQSRDTRGLLDFRRLQLTTFDGHETYVYPEDVRRVEYFPDDEWAKMAEAQKKAREEQEAEKKREEEASAKAKAAALTAWDALPRWKKIGKARPNIKVIPPGDKT